MLTHKIHDTGGDEKKLREDKQRRHAQSKIDEEGEPRRKYCSTAASVPSAPLGVMVIEGGKARILWPPPRLRRQEGEEEGYVGCRGLSSSERDGRPKTWRLTLFGDPPHACHVLCTRSFLTKHAVASSFFFLLHERRGSQHGTHLLFQRPHANDIYIYFFFQ